MFKIVKNRIYQENFRNRILTLCLVLFVTFQFPTTSVGEGLSLEFLNGYQAGYLTALNRKPVTQSQLFDVEVFRLVFEGLLDKDPELQHASLSVALDRAMKALILDAMHEQLTHPLEKIPGEAPPGPRPRR